MEGGGMLMVKHCRVLHDILKLNTEDVSDTLVLLYLTTGVTRNNSVTLIFTVLVTLNCHVVLPWFSFPVNSTQSVYTQYSTALNRRPQNVTADCG